MKNKKRLLLVIGILLLVVGVSFAYYVMYINFTGTGSEVSGITKEINDVTVTVEGKLDFSDTDILPGHKNISSIKLTATGEKEVYYNLIWNGTNTLANQLNYTVYRVDSEKEVSMSCTEKEQYLIGEIRFYEECTMANESALGEVISTGTIGTTSENTKTVLKSQESITATTNGTTTYYYVVIEFPNINVKQEQVENGTFSGEATVEPAILYAYHDVDTVLGTLAVYDDTPDFSGTSKEADNGNGYCYYEGNLVRKYFGYSSSGFSLLSEKDCSEIYKSVDPSGNVEYYDSGSVEEFLRNKLYQGTATWDSDTSTCTFNNKSVYYWKTGSKNVTQDMCGDVFCDSNNNCRTGLFKIDNGTTFE